MYGALLGDKIRSCMNSPLDAINRKRVGIIRAEYCNAYAGYSLMGICVFYDIQSAILGGPPMEVDAGY